MATYRIFVENQISGDAVKAFSFDVPTDDDALAIFEDTSRLWNADHQVELWQPATRKAWVVSAGKAVTQ